MTCCCRLLNKLDFEVVTLPHIIYKIYFIHMKQKVADGNLNVTKIIKFYKIDQSD